MSRAAQTTRTRRSHAHSQSTLVSTNEMGALFEDVDQSAEYHLRQQLLESDKENNALRNRVSTLEEELLHRPPIEDVRKLHQDMKALDLLLGGTQRENEKCMQELERLRSREKVLEKAIASLAGDNWQAHLGLDFSSGSKIAGGPDIDEHKRGSNSSLRGFTPTAQKAAEPADLIRLLILGMEEKLQSREEALLKLVEIAENRIEEAHAM